MKSHLVLLIVVVCISGCVSTSSPEVYDLGPSATISKIDDGYSISGTINIEGNPPSRARFQGVKLVVKNQSETLAEKKLGDIGKGDKPLEFDIITKGVPDKILVKYNNLVSSNGKPEVFGYIRSGGSINYTVFYDYDPEY